MPDFVRKLSALVLLLLIPLQGIAASTQSILQCPPVEAGVTYSPDRDDGAAQERDDESGKNIVHGHSFCHQPLSGIPVIPAAATTPDFPVLESSVSLLPSLFFPEQPQRPPFSR